MKNRLALLFLCLVSFLRSSTGQEITPEKLGFKPFTLHDKALGRIDYYISAKDMDKAKPVLLYLDGSGAYPLFQYTERGIGSSIILDFQKLSQLFHLVLISKPGLPFIDSVQFDREIGMPVYETPQAYREKLSLEWRVNSAKTVLKKALAALKVKDKKVVVFGVSEGFQVGAKLASIDKTVSHLILLVGNGLNQIYDFIIQNRIDAESGALSDQEAQKNVDSLYLVAKDIYANPQATDKEWYGHTYLRWSSFTNNSPTDNILSLDIPVYIVAAANDKNTSVLGTDYLYLECLRRKKGNVFYNVYPVNHALSQIVQDENGNIVSKKDYRNEIIEAAFEWLKGYGIWSN